MRKKTSQIQLQTSVENFNNTTIDKYGYFDLNILEITVKVYIYRRWIINFKINCEEIYLAKIS